MDKYEPAALAAEPALHLFYARVFAIAAAGVLGFALWLIVQPFLAPTAWALFLAFLLLPLHRRMTRRFDGRANASAALLTTGTFIMLIGPVAAMGAALVSQTSELLQWVQATLGQQPNQQYR